MSHKVFFSASLALILLAGMVMAAGAAPPEIAHIHPDYAGSHLFRNAPHIITGENFAEGMEVYTWVLSPEKTVVVEAARLLGTSAEPRLPELPPLDEAGRTRQGDRWLKSGYPDWDVIYRWNGPNPGYGLTVFDIEGRTLVTTLAAARADMHASVVWLKNKDGFSKPFPINMAQPKWMSENILQPGQYLRLYGQGLKIRYKQPLLAFRKGNELRILEAPKPVYNMDFDDTRLVEVLIPTDMEPGDYTVYFHNGFGGRFGWAKAGALKIEPRQSKAEKIFRVRDYGTVGDGEANDTAAIRKTLSAASAAGGGTVYFAPGTYMVDESLLVPSGVKLRGGSRENTIIEGFGFDPNVAPPDGRRTWSSDKPIPCSVLLLQPYTAMERIGVRGETARGTAGQTVQAVMGDEKTPPLSQGAVFGRIKLLDVQVKGDFGCAPSYTPRRVAYGVEVRDSVFYGNLGFFALMIRGEYVNNRINGGTITGTGYVDSLIEKNVMQDGASRFMFMFPVRNTLVRYNELYNFSTKGIGNFGTHEAFLSHGGSKKYVGKATSAGQDTLTDKRQSWAPGELSHGKLWHMSGMSTVLITAGRGFGQYRHVKANTADTMILEKPWSVVPDESSEYVVGNFYVDSMWYGNYLDGMGQYQMGSEHINVVAERQRHNQCGSIFLEGSDGATDYQAPRLAWYNTYLDCHMEGSMMAYRIFENTERPIEGPVFFGNAAIGNNIINPHYRAPSAWHGALEEQSVGIAFRYPVPRSGWTATGRTSHTIIAANTIFGAEAGILVRDYARKTFILNNELRSLDHPILDGGSGTVQRGNKIITYSLDKIGETQSSSLPDTTGPDLLKGKEMPTVKYRYSEKVVPQPASAFAGDFLRTWIPLQTYIPADVESPKVQEECAGNLKKLYGILQAYEKKNGALPRAVFYPDKPLTDVDSLTVLLGRDARPLLRCPAAGPDFDKLGWLNYIWNDELSGRKLSDVQDRKGTWLLIDFSAPHAWGVTNRNMGHRGGVNVLYADGHVEWLEAAKVKERYSWCQ